MKEEARKMDTKQQFNIIQTILLGLVLGAGVVGILGSGGGGGGGGSANKILAKGGFNEYSTTAYGYGGQGGSVYIYNGLEGYGGGGDIVIKRSGKANASFTFSKSENDADLGTNPVEVTEDTTFALLSSLNEAEPAAGTVYMVENSSYIVVSEGNTTPDTTIINRNIATGLSVASGKTLTIPYDEGETYYVYINLQNDVVNKGTIKTSDKSATQKSQINLSADAYYGGPSSSIITAGTNAGQNGGNVLICTNAIYNKGSIDTSGADNEAGLAGSAGVVFMGGECDVSPLAIENSGNITAEGGSGSNVHSGNNGGYVGLYTEEGHIYNSGDISTKGGYGGSASGNGGGNGAQVSLKTNLAGEIRNSGDIDTSGGDAASNTSAGYGGQVSIRAQGGGLTSSGKITTRGGNGLGTASSGNYGGNVSIYTWHDSEYIDLKPCADCTAGSVTLSGTIDASGGSSRDGNINARGGSISIGVYATDYPEGQGITLLGYGEINTSAGNGHSPYQAGNINIYNLDSFDGALGTAGHIVNETDLVAVGGTATGEGTANGSYGGSVYLNAGCNWLYCHATLATATVTNSGDIVTTGGGATGATASGGYNGNVRILGFAGTTNRGNIAAKGGDAAYQGGPVFNGIEISAATGNVSNIGNILLEGGAGESGGGTVYNSIDIFNNINADVRYDGTFDTTVENSGNLSVSGGAGDDEGGSANAIYIEGKKVTNRGALKADGGDADPAAGGSFGGNAGIIFLNSTSTTSVDQSTTNSGALSVSGGTGETAGDDGCTIIDGVESGVCPALPE